MRDVVKIVIVVLMLSLLLATGPAFAFMPSDRGANAPQTVWSDLGARGTVSGRVVTSLDLTKGVEGAYVALINTMNNRQEYFNTTTDANGNYRFTGVNATFSSGLYKGPDGTSGSYQQGINVYMIYANISAGEGYSGSFGVDANHTSMVLDPVVIYIPDSEGVVTPEPTSDAPEPTAVVTPVPATPTPEPTPVPAGPPSFLLPGVGALILVIVIAAYFLYGRKSSGK